MTFEKRSVVGEIIYDTIAEKEIAKHADPAFHRAGKIRIS